MAIRHATYHDAPAIKHLLQALGYTSTVSLLVQQLERLFDKDDHQVFVYELRKEVVGFTSVHYLPQLGFEGRGAVISYLSIDETVKDQGIGKALENYLTEQARQKKCDQILVYGLDGSSSGQQFYEQQGYQEYPKYFTKRLIYAE